MKGLVSFKNIKEGDIIYELIDSTFYMEYTAIQTNIFGENRICLVCNDERIPATLRKPLHFGLFDLTRLFK